MHFFFKISENKKCLWPFALVLGVSVNRASKGLNFKVSWASVRLAVSDLNHGIFLIGGSVGNRNYRNFALFSL